MHNLILQFRKELLTRVYPMKTTKMVKKYVVVLLNNHVKLSALKISFENIYCLYSELAERMNLDPSDQSDADEEEESRQFYISPKKCAKYQRRCFRVQTYCVPGGHQHYKCPKWQDRCNRYKSFCVQPSPIQPSPIQPSPLG